MKVWLFKVRSKTN